MNSHERNHVKMIERRIAFLENRIANYVGKSDSYDKAELSALKWALSKIKENA